MRRSKRTSSSSLELLLDTICNTFGGILFLAILTCVMLKNTTLRDVPALGSPASEADLLGVQGKLESATKRLLTLRAAQAGQQESLERFAVPELADLVARRRRLQGECDALVDERVALLAEIAKLEAGNQRLAEDRAQRKRDLAQAEARAKEALRLLESERARRTQDIRLPKVRSTFKREIALVVRYGRLYVEHRYDPSGLRAGLNTDDFVLLADTPTHAEATPKPYAGIPVLGPEARLAIVRRLREFDPSSQYLATVVWPDSFTAFQSLKAVLIELGFEYRLMPVDDGETVIDRGGLGGQVQ